jgi:hypothetical protein
VISIDDPDLQLVEGHYVVWVAGKGGAPLRVKVQPYAWEALHAHRPAAGIPDGPLFRRVYAVGTPYEAVANPAASQRIILANLRYGKPHGHVVHDR